MADKKYYCQNCGAELEKSIQGFMPRGQETVEIKASGGVLICPGCNMANPADETTESGPSTDTPPPEASPRGEPDPPRVEDLIVPEGEEFEPAPTTSPEVDEAGKEIAPEPAAVEEDVKAAEYQRLIDSGISEEEAHKTVFGGQ